MKVKAIWEFEFDDVGYDPEMVDIPLLAKDATRCELAYLLKKRDIIADDFEYVVDEDESAKQENVNPTSHWERKVYKHLWSTNVRVQYECHHCHGLSYPDPF